MKITAPNRSIKNKARTLAEFKKIVESRHFKIEAAVTLCDKKHSVLSETMRIGSYTEAYAFCDEYGIKMISYQGVYSQPPKEVRLRTREEFYR